jgi:hypothetical protein
MPCTKPRGGVTFLAMSGKVRTDHTQKLCYRAHRHAATMALSVCSYERGVICAAARLKQRSVSDANLCAMCASCCVISTHRDRDQS